MAVEVKLTFNSVDEAIVALGKMVLAKDVKAPPVAPVEKTPRQARSDAGKARGPYKKDEPNAGAVAQPVNAATSGNDAGRATAESRPANTGTTAPGNGAQAPTPTATTPPLVPPQPTPAPIPAAPAAVSAAATPTPAPTPTAAGPVPTTDDVQAAVEKLFLAKGFEECEGLLKLRFGVPRGKDIVPERRAEFIAKAARVIAGEAV